MSDERKDLPGVNAPNFSERVKEALQTYLGTRGDVLDRGLTLRDLKDAGLIALRPGLGLGGTSGGTSRPIAGPGPAVVYEVDLSPPPAPEGLAAKTSGKSIQVTINPQTYTQGHGPGKVIVFGAKYLAADPLPTYSGSAVLAEFTGDVFAFPVDNGSLYRIWAKSVSVDGVESSIAGGINGVEPVAGLLEDVSIANLTASRIRSGSITVGQFIQSSNFLSGVRGWRINGNGIAEFSGVIVRGTVYASAGVIGCNTIDATGVESPSYAAGTNGWRLDSTGTIRAFAPGDRIFDMAATGTMPVLKAGTKFYVLADGSAFFGGSLGANTVTAETIVSESVGKPFSLFAYPQADTGTIGGSAALTSADGMMNLMVIGPRNAVAGHLFGTASVSGSYLVSGNFGTITTRILVDEYSGVDGTGTVTTSDPIYQTAAADSRNTAVNIYASPVTVFAIKLAATTKSVKITLSARNNNSSQVAYLSNLGISAAVLQR